MSDAAVKSAPPLLVIGGGFCGQRLAAAAQRQGRAVTLTHRSEAPPSQAPEGSRWLRFDPDHGVVPSADALADFPHVVVTIPPDGSGRDPVLEALGGQLAQLPLTWLGYLSTTGVYGDLGGAWADEASPTNPGQERSRSRLTCELAWRQSGLPVQCFRLPAIYGPGRSPLTTLAQGQSRLVHKHGQVFCRIHVDDIAGALLHCLEQPADQRPAVVNVSDDRPCSSSEVLGFAAHLLGRKLPAFQSYDTIAASMGPMARSFWQENRRIRNTLLCGHLGYRLRYPSYREGLLACLEEELAPSG